MLHYVTGDMFQPTYDAIVNTVNCVGVMGKGLALSFKQKYPDNFLAYRQFCFQHKLKPDICLYMEHLPSSSTWQPKIIGGIRPRCNMSSTGRTPLLLGFGTIRRSRPSQFQSLVADVVV